MSNTALLILGMHRSGTSAFTRVANLLGAGLPGDVMPPGPGNSAGYWETLEIVAAHEAFLNSVGSHWGDLLPLPTRSLHSQEAENLATVLEAFVRDSFQSDDFLVFKDPRMCRLIPIWRRLPSSLDLKLGAILPVRHPYEVAQSLEARDSMLMERGLLLWLRYILDAERESRGLKRSFVSFDELLNDWRAEVERIATDLEIIWPGYSVETEEAIDAFLSKKNKHHWVSHDLKMSSGALWENLSATWDGLSLLRKNPVDSEAMKMLDSVSDSLGMASKLFGPIVTGQDRSLSDSIQKNGELELALGEEQRSNEALRIVNGELQNEVENVIGGLREEVEGLRHEIGAVKSENLALRESTSWKLTAPLRVVSELMGPVGTIGKSRIRASLSFLARRVARPGLRLVLGHSRAGRKRLALMENKYRILMAGGATAIHQDPTVGLEEAKAKLRDEANSAYRKFLESGKSLVFPENEAPEISVILILFNQAELTYTCLNSLAESVQKRGSPSVEVILMDNASSDSTGVLLDHLEGVKIIRNRKNLGFLKAVNLASEKALGEHLLLLNNDAVLRDGALAAALETLRSDQKIGAVGGRIFLPDQTLQEAGNIIWNDGSCLGYLRGAASHDPRAMFRRDVDYCSGVFLLTPRILFEELGRFDEAFAPAYYEEADYCLRLREAGYRVVYEPGAAIDHYEFGSSEKSQDALDLQRRNQGVFMKKHQERLKGEHCEPLPQNILLARARDRRPRILFIDDRVPLQDYGAGCPRAQEMIRGLVHNGWFVTHYPLRFPKEDWGKTYRNIPRGVEVMQGRGVERLQEFLEARKGYYNTILVSRPHNMQFLSDLIAESPELVQGVKLAYDAEAVFALREIRAASVLGKPLSEKRAEAMIAKELSLIQHADQVLTVSNAEAKNFQAHGFDDVHVLGHAIPVMPSQAQFAKRSGLLFVGALTDDNTPNTDSVLWFIEKVLPHLRQKSTEMGTVTFVGRSGAPSLRNLDQEAGCDFPGRQDDLTRYYNSARIFIAPTRFSAGIPLKVIEAAAHGLPVVATRLIQEQLDWKDGEEILVGDTPAEMIDAVSQLYEDAELWNRIRANALARVAKESSREFFFDVLERALPEGSPRIQGS